MFPRSNVFRALHQWRSVPDGPPSHPLPLPLPLTPEPSSFVTAVRSSASLRVLKPLHAAVLRHHPDDLVLSVALACRYSQLGLPRAALSLLSPAAADPSLVPAGDTFLWNLLVRGLVESGAHDRALALYRQMRQPRGGAQPNNFTFPPVLKACSYLGDFEEGVKIHGDAAELGYESDVFVRNSLIAMYSKSGAVDTAKRLFDEMPDRKVIVQNAIMGMYSRCGKIEQARKLFDGIAEKDLASWSSMIEAYARADMFEEAMKLFRNMKLLEIVPDRVTLLGVTRGCSNSAVASLRHAQLIHGFAIRSLLIEDLMVETAVIDSYVRRGSLNSARRIFDQMREKNLVTWSIMISGYGMHGRGVEVLELFNRMKCLMKPDHITFVSVLSACSHAGLIDEGWQCFNSMTTEFGIVAHSEHYACMVDLLGRAGQLEKAREFIEKMPIKPDCSVWGSLLGACRIHPDAKITELAATSLFELDPQNSGRYILLSNIYTSLGKIEEAHSIRVLMRKRGVKKIAGYTVIELNNKLYKFLVGDCSNPQSDLIYRELERLMDRIKEAGYVPNTNFALHDVEEETQVKSLYMHSEKLAIVFGLINTRPESTIRVHKNLRVCGDCHTATKFISKVTKRKIVMRDSHRFHHFSDGECSCGDYW
ncbi:PPR repeat [Musa troglodytarum]|uniref:PPR repeat n=2 Tax=Musa troglodytarum TaxID=320322 RepID=A0A9E7KGM3_9LILI|nr:PPR repeat [Musa troglodytarum]